MRLRSLFHLTPSRTLFFEDLPSPGSPLNFTATGTGEASFVFGATFVPNEVSTVAIYRGVQVKKVVQLLDPLTKAAKGSPLSSATIGQLGSP